MAAETGESFLNPTRRSYLYEGSRNSGNKTRIILIIVGIIVLVALVAYAVIATGGQGGEDMEIQPTPTVSEEPSPTPTEEPTPAQNPTQPPTPTGTAKANIDKTSGLDRADLRVIIQNGGGVAGAATKAANKLKELGYVIASTGNADSFDYEQTEIRVKSTKRAYLDLLKRDLSDDYTIGNTSTNYTGGEDALIIIGKE